MFLADPVPADTTLDAAQQKLILGGEFTMWAEQIHPETVDSRVWPRGLAVAERLWSPQSDRDVSYMYERLRIASAELEDVGMRHIAGPEILRRDLAGAQSGPHVEALETLAAVTEPYSFGERYQGQHTDGYTSLDRLVDAVVADPPSRQEIAGDVDAIVGKVTMPPPTGKDVPNTSGDVPAGFRPNRQEAMRDLRQRFLAWQRTTPVLLDLADDTPRLNDTRTLDLELNALGALGMEAVGYLDARTAPPAPWAQHAEELLDSAQKGSALVHFTFIGSMRKLVFAASQPR